MGKSKDDKKNEKQMVSATVDNTHRKVWDKDEFSAKAAEREKQVVGRLSVSALAPPQSSSPFSCPPSGPHRQSLHAVIRNDTASPSRLLEKARPYTFRRRAPEICSISQEQEAEESAYDAKKRRRIGMHLKDLADALIWR